ncbi:uncharacterized protein BDR25DRAFT_360447 [Lindgomyces ingoldianus]|uniref:Uncharacterized protein n=1 Tax=Lindgomyces ingoldianus TaxID=673940 RepID=A0ACB6QEQ2_9PLEO|nr:uncharacterized protein BDR25DRAFT_360447 [Lindgomyces ingoldianus]KAF2465494.1 hypothetical protein BDR25DRAFT_360447 [Lindgomyces ingoldianus]
MALEVVGYFSWFLAQKIILSQVFVVVYVHSLMLASQNTTLKGKAPRGLLPWKARWEIVDIYGRITDLSSLKPKRNKPHLLNFPTMPYATTSFTRSTKKEVTDSFNTIIIKIVSGIHH